jgi:MscS family membrane protein
MTSLIPRLPPVLRDLGPLGLRWWQWLALAGLVVLGWAAGFAFSRATRRLLARLTSRTANTWDDATVARLGAPLTFGWLLALVALALPAFELPREAEAFAHRVMSAAFLLLVFWFVLRAVDIAARVLAVSPWAQEHPASRTLVPLGTRVGKVLVVALGVVALLAELGYPVASLVAGLGIGGLALALAAQKTIENLLGAFALGLDQPFREGDVVKVEDFTATVEAVGLRSTRFRTGDRTIISIPNGRLSEMRLESLSARDRLHLSCTLGLARSTTAAQMRRVLESLAAVLRAHPKIWPGGFVVRLKALGESSLDVDVEAWFSTADWNEFRTIRQDVLLQFMEAIEQAGTSLAFPTRTLHLVEPRRPA